MAIVPDFSHMSQFDREEIAHLGEDIQKSASGHGKRLKNRKGEARDVCLAVFNLGVAISNFTKLNGHMAIWASFSPQMFDGDDLTTTEVGEDG